MHYETGGSLTVRDFPRSDPPPHAHHDWDSAFALGGKPEGLSQMMSQGRLFSSAAAAVWRPTLTIESKHCAFASISSRLIHPIGQRGCLKEVPCTGMFCAGARVAKSGCGERETYLPSRDNSAGGRSGQKCGFRQSLNRLSSAWTRRR